PRSSRRSLSQAHSPTLACIPDQPTPRRAERHKRELSKFSSFHLITMTLGCSRTCSAIPATGVWIYGCRSSRSHLILLDLAVGHDPFPHLDRLLRKVHLEQAEGHSSAILLGGLRKFCRRSQRSKAAGEILESLFGEVTVAIVGEQGAIDLTLLQCREYFAGLILLLAGIGLAKKQSSDLAGNVAGGFDRVLIDKNDHSHACVRKNQIVRSEAGDFAAMLDGALSEFLPHIHAQPIARSQAVLEYDFFFHLRVRGRTEH